MIRAGMRQEDVQSIEDLCDWIETYKDAIYVRASFPNGEVANVALNKLPVDMAIEHTLRFLREGRLPVIVTSDAEHWEKT